MTRSTWKSAVFFAITKYTLSQLCKLSDLTCEMINDT